MFECVGTHINIHGCMDACLCGNGEEPRTHWEFPSSTTDRPFSLRVLLGFFSFFFFWLRCENWQLTAFSDRPLKIG